MKDIILGLARHFLTLGGGYIVSHGMATSSEADAIMGGSIALLGVVLSILDKKKKAA
jgi:hypothetical protein